MYRTNYNRTNAHRRTDREPGEAGEGNPGAPTLPTGAHPEGRGSGRVAMRRGSAGEAGPGRACHTPRAASPPVGLGIGLSGESKTCQNKKVFRGGCMDFVIRDGVKVYPKKARTAGKAIRYFCGECMGLSRRVPLLKGGKMPDEVKGCTDPDCPLFEFRMGKNPYHGATGRKGNADHLKVCPKTPGNKGS